MRLLVGSLAQIKLASLAIVIGEALRPGAAFVSGFTEGDTTKSIHRRLTWRILRQGIGLVGNSALRLLHLHVPVTLLVAERTLGSVDRNLVKIWRPQARELRVLIREQATLQ